MRNAYSRTWIMARTLKNVENEKNTPLTYNMARKTQNLNNEKSVHFSFSQYLSVSRPNTGHTVFVSHFPRFSVFLAIIQVLQCAFLIFQVFLYFSPYSKSYSECFSLSMIFSYFPIQSYSVHFSFFTFFRVSRHISRPTVCVSYFP